MARFWFVLCLLSAPAWASFHFFPPTGWTDLSPGAPSENFAGLAPNELASVKHSSATFFAADLRAGDGHFRRYAVAVVYAEQEPISEGYLEAFTRGVENSGDEQVPHLIDRRVVTLKGVRCGRIVAERRDDGALRRQLSYLIPGHEGVAYLTYRMPAEDFAGEEASLEAAVLRTEGAAESSWWARTWESKQSRLTLRVGIAFVAVVLAVAYSRRRRATGRR